MSALCTICGVSLEQPVEGCPGHVAIVRTPMMSFGDYEAARRQQQKLNRRFEQHVECEDLIWSAIIWANHMRVVDVHLGRESLDIAFNIEPETPEERHARAMAAMEEMAPDLSRLRE